MTQMRCVGVVEPPLGRGTLLVSLMMSLAGQYCLMTFSGTATVFARKFDILSSVLHDPFILPGRQHV